MNIRIQVFVAYTINVFVVAVMLVFPYACNAGLSGEQVDSQIGKVSDEELALLVEQQKLLVSAFLNMQQKLKLLQDELSAAKLQLARLDAKSSNAAPPMPLATAGIQKDLAKPDVVMSQVMAQQDIPRLQNELLFAALGLFALWLGLRHYTKIKARSRTCMQGDTGPVLKRAGNVVSAQSVSMPTAAAQRPFHPDSSQAPAAILPPKANTVRNTTTLSECAPAKKTEGKATEEDSMLEEAGLYAANGRMDKGAEILCEIIERNPLKIDAWTLLLSVYSALCKVAEFEKTAREFLKYHKNSHAWSGIQVLGRTLDRDNPLYADQNGQIAASPLLPDALNLHRPIGDILIEMGILSKREIMKYLDDFDPKQHGRFGGYLVARKVISIAQLDQALLQQQGVRAEAKCGDLPSLQEIEKFLVDFDPKQHGSVSKFLASRNVVTPEQLGRLLQQSSGCSAPIKKPSADNSPHFGNLAMS